MEKFDRLVGGILKESDTENIRTNSYDQIEKLQRFKTPEEIAMIDYISDAINKIRGNYDLPARNIAIDDVFIVQKIKYQTANGDSLGYASTMGRHVAIADAGENIPNFVKLIHEILHYQSYTAIQTVINNDQNIAPYRSGLSLITRDAEDDYLKYLNEAMTELLTKEIFEKAKVENDMIKDAYIDYQNEYAERKVRARKHYNGLLDSFMDVGMPLDDKNTFYIHKDGVTWENFPYAENLNLLNRLVGKIYVKNSNKFESEEDVMEIFKKAYFTGDLLKLGKLIDRTFGRGTFRKIGLLRRGGNLDEILKSPNLNQDTTIFANTNPEKILPQKSAKQSPNPFEKGGQLYQARTRIDNSQDESEYERRLSELMD